MYLIKNAVVYAPKKLGKKDLLIAGGKIVKMADEITIGCEKLGVKIIDATGKFLTPGIIDQHVHVIGAGGEGGFTTRTPEMQISNIVKYGITTIVCLRGTDGTARNMETLYAKAKALEQEGLTTYMLTGSFEVPTDTITGSVRSDVVLIDKVIGAKTTVSDRRSSQPTQSEIERIMAEAYTGGLVGGKKGYTHFHLGDGKRRLNMLLDIMDETELPVYLFIPTHVNRDKDLFMQSMEFAKRGGIIDITSGLGPKYGIENGIDPSVAVKMCVEAGVPMENVTMSSDANGSMVVYDEKGDPVKVVVTPVETLLDELKEMVFTEKLPLEDSLKVITENVAKAIGVYPEKGIISEDIDADFILFTPELEIDAVFAKGKQVADSKGALVYGLFENTTIG